jgi:hypothetical protein
MITANTRPNFVNNAWGGGSGLNWFKQQIAAWRAVGIIPIFSSGGSGPSCGSLTSEGPEVITVGSTDQLDKLSNSGRGPGLNGIIKPDLVAPGVNIVSGIKFI